MRRAFALAIGLLWLTAAPARADSTTDSTPGKRPGGPADAGKRPGDPADASWRPDGMVGGLWIERREVRGSPYEEIRVTAVRSLNLARLCDVVFDGGRAVQSSVRFKKRELLRETGVERWMYEQIAVPWVSDRDYVMHTKLEAPPSTGRCEVSFSTVDEPSRPPVRGFVRIPAIRGRWLAAPLADGRLWIGYETFSDPGGGIPAFLARAGQRDAAVEFVENVLALAASSPPTAGTASSPPTAGAASSPPTAGTASSPPTAGRTVAQ